MQNISYEEYIRSILGYPPMNQNIYSNYNMNYQNTNMLNASQFDDLYEDVSDLDLEDYYPEIYKNIYPLIRKKCDNISKSDITKEFIENVCEDIYNEFQEKSEIEININLKNEIKTTNMMRSTTRKPDTRIKENTTEKRETRQRDNRLMDVIKILLIRELLDRHNRPNRSNRPNRPPFPPNNRPPMPPPFPPNNRPPIGNIYK